MRKIFILSCALALLLLVAFKVQHAMYLAATNRPFLGTWITGRFGFPNGPQTRLEFERGGKLWITSFGQERWLAHWEEGTQPHELIFSGLDPAQPKARESCRWFTSRSGLMLMPAPRPGMARWMSHPHSGYTLDHNYVRPRENTWPAAPAVTGRWVSSLSSRPFRTRAGELRWIPYQRTLLEVLPGGELWLYQEGQSRHHGRWSAPDDGQGFTTFSLVDEDAGAPGNGEIWTGSAFLRPGAYGSLNLGFWGRQRDRGAAPGARRPFADAGPLRRVSDAPPDRRPFLGVWHTGEREQGIPFTLEFKPGGELTITEPGHALRRGAWSEVGPWPRLTLTGLDAARSERKTEWYWWCEPEMHGRRRDQDGTVRPFSRAETLRLFGANAPPTQADSGKSLELERGPALSVEGKKIVPAPGGDH